MLNYSATAFGVTTRDVLRYAVLKAAPVSSETWHRVVGYTAVSKKTGASIIMVNFTLYPAVTVQRGSRRVPQLFNLGAIKADSHIACRAHAVHLPCRAAKGLECVFPI